MAKLAPIFNDAQFINAIPATGAKLFTYAAGSTTKQATYTGIDGLTPQANPIILNSRGEPANPIWLTEGLVYKFVFAPSTDTDPPSSPIRTIDNITGVNDASITIDQWVSSGVVPTYVSPTSFTLPGDQTSAFQVGRRLKLTITAGTVYGTITNSVFGAVTTVTVLLDSGVLDSGLSSVSYGLINPTSGSLPYDISAQNIQAQKYTAFTTAGILTAYTLAPLPEITSNVLNARFNIALHVAPGTSPTLSVSGQTAKNLKYYDATGVKQFITAAVAPAGWISDILYDGTDWLVLNILPSNITNSVVATRQSILYGPIASGIADLIPQSQIGNTLAAGVTLKGSTAAFLASVGNGFNTDGSQRNVNKIRSTDLNIPNLTASTTNYIWYDTLADTAGFVTVADVFQYGGSIPVTNNQYTYDYLNHIMYLGSGAVAAQSNRIIVAEVDTSGTLVTAIRVRAYAGQYDSGYTATLVAANAAYTKNHNIGTKEIDVTETIICTTNDNGYVVGDTLDNQQSGNTANYCFMPAANKLKNTVVMRRGANNSYFVANATTGVQTALTIASWSYKITAKRKF